MRCAVRAMRFEEQVSKFDRGLWDLAQAQALSTHFDPEVHTSGMQGRDLLCNGRTGKAQH